MDIYFAVNNKMLKIAGMWLPLATAKLPERIFYLTYDIIIIAYSCIFYLICECIKFSESLVDLTIFMFYIKMVITHIWGTAKILIWHYKRAQIFKLLDTLKRSSDKIEKNWKEHLMANKFRTWCTMVLATGVSIAGSFPVFFKLILNSDSLYQHSDGTVLTNTTRKMIVHSLPYISWIPFEYQSSRFRYFLGALFQWHPTFQQGAMIAGYIAMQFQAVQASYGLIRQRSLIKLGIPDQSEKEKDCALLAKEMQYEMIKVTERVQVLIKTCKVMEDMFTYLILIQTMFSLSALCSCIYMVTTLSIHDRQFTMELIFCMGVMYELSLYSHTGSLVTHEAQHIPDALFYSKWYTSETSYKRTIIINMIRLQKPIYFTLGKFQPIGLSTFVSIVKAAYSICAVVKSMDTE